MRIPQAIVGNQAIRPLQALEIKETNADITARMDSKLGSNRTFSGENLEKLCWEPVSLIGTRAVFYARRGYQVDKVVFVPAGRHGIRR